MKLLARLTVLPVLVVVSGCGGGGESVSTNLPSGISELRVSPALIGVGDEATVEVAFVPPISSDLTSDVDEDGQNDLQTEAFELVVRIPRGFQYVTGSSGITDVFLRDILVNNPAPRSPNGIDLCTDGVRALTYSFARGELNAESPVTTKIRFRVQSAETAQGFVEAADAAAIGDVCNEPAEVSEPLAAVPTE